MLNSFPLQLCVGSVLGFLAGLGVGGGSLLILWLTLVLGMDPDTARAVNLLFFLPAAAVSCLFRSRRGQLRRTVCLPAILSAAAAAVLLCLFSPGWDTALLRKLFGGLLIAAGLRELLCSKK